MPTGHLSIPPTSTTRTVRAIVPPHVVAETLGNSRDALLARLTRALENDQRVQDAWLTGSFGRGEADEWSDLDLHVAVADEDLGTIIERRRETFAVAGEIVLVQAGFPSDCMPGGTFWLVVYPGPMHIDWNIGPVSQAKRASASVLLFERTPIPLFAEPSPPSPEHIRQTAQRALEFFWAMAPIALKYAGRGHTQLAASQCTLLRGGYTRLWRCLHRPELTVQDEYEQNRLLEPELNAVMPRFGAVIDGPAAVALIRQFCAAVEALHPALASLGVDVPERMTGEVASLANVAASEAARGGTRPTQGSRR